ncbi:hypothetical protein [Salinirubrum litoreum]|uniref:Nucleotide modification associated domain-containing protein n=1 Tax=Salinirubrum litoreum TaxID=1126234 RepID=A0ABD5RDP9_9EURY
MRAIAINVAANTNLPGFRGPIYPDGSFEYVPIPEREPTGEQVPTYADLDLRLPIPDDVADTPVHLDPEFAGYADCDRYTYGDEHGVKAGPLSDLDAGDYLFFYATLSTHDWPDGAESTDDTGPADDRLDWIAPDWGAYLIGHFRVRRAITGEQYHDLPAGEQSVFASNAHVRRADFDAKVLVEGDDGSRLYDCAVPLSSPDAGATANRLVTDLSNDSGKGPWWRRRFWYDGEATREILDLSDSGAENRT